MRRGKSAIVVLALTLGACSKNDAKPEVSAATSAVTIPVDGMACNRCASRVEKALTGLDGVGDAEVSLAQKRVVVHFDPHRTSADKLASAIDQAGFKAGVPSEPAR